MNILAVSLGLLLFCGSYVKGLENDELDGVNVLEELKSNVPNCNITQFVQSNNDDNELKSDLQKYCSASISLKQYRLLCNMLSYELQKACNLPVGRLPSAAKYVNQDSAKKVCQMRNILNTSFWIRNRITDGGKKQIGVSAENLCDTVTNQAETVRLARFFYKIAPRVRIYDSTENSVKSQSNTTNDKISSQSAVEVEKSNTTNDKISSQSVVEVEKSNTSDRNDSTQAAKDASPQSIESKPAKTDESPSQPKDNATQSDDKSKVKNNESVELKKENVNQVVNGSTNATGQAIENIGTTIVDTKDNKTSQSVKTGEDKGTSKEEDKKTSEVKSNVDDKINSSSNGTSTSDNATSPVHPNKEEKTEKSSDITKTEVTKLSNDSMKELSANSSQIILSESKTNKNDKQDVETPKDQGNLKDDDNDDDDDKEGNKKDAQSLDGQQNQQIPQPEISNKKEDEKVGLGDSKNPGAQVVEKEQIVEEANVNKTSDNINEVDKNDKQNMEEEEDDIKKDDRAGDRDENEPDDVDDDEAEKQVKDQQEESDKNDYRTAVGNKGRTEIDKSPTRMEIKKPINEEDNRYNKFGDSNNRGSNFDSSIKRIKAPPEKYSDDDGWSGSFVTYFLLFTLLVVVAYLALHNKNKLMAYVVEGRRSAASRTGSRPSHRGYEKLKNVNDIIPIDDKSPVTNKEATILKA